jgi:hypothetical protein
MPAYEGVASEEQVVAMIAAIRAMDGGRSAAR